MSSKPLNMTKAAGSAMRRVVLAREANGPLGRCDQEDFDTSPSIDAIGLNPAHAFVLFTDFAQQSGGTLPAWLTFRDVSAAGAPTKNYDDDAAGGTYTFAHDNTDEVQSVGLDSADGLTILSTGGPILQCRVKLNFAAAALSADQRFVCGLGSAWNATLDSIATHAWFRIEGASLNLLCEGDDGTTDTNDQDTTIDIVDDTFITLRIDMTDLSAVQFLVDEEAGDGFVLRGTVSMPLATGNLQPFIIQQKDAGTETDAVTVDYLRILAGRA